MSWILLFALMLILLGVFYLALLLLHMELKARVRAIEEHLYDKFGELP